MGGKYGSIWTSRRDLTVSLGEQGYAGQALRFDGVDDWARLDGEVSLQNASFTIAAWAKRDSAGKDATIIGHGGSLGYWDRAFLSFGFVYDNAEDKFACNVNSLYSYADPLETPSGTDLEWHHWACTFDAENQTRTIYRDGTAVISDTLISDNPFGSGQFSVGRSNDARSPDYFDGLIDEVEVYLRALTPAEIMAKNRGLRLHLDFENGRYADISPLKNYVTCDTCTLFESGGEVGDYANFDVDTAYEVSGQGINLSDNQFSYAFWLYPPRSGDYSRFNNDIISYAPSLTLVGTRYPEFALDCPASNPIHFDTSLSNGTWQHVIVTNDNNEAILYIDGRQSDISNRACAGVVEIEHQLIGDGLDNDGKLDEVQIYNYALDAQEAADVYSSQILLHLPFDELPGQNNFQSDTGSQAAACLDDTTCPDSGLPGRLNQALRFDGQDDYLALGEASELGLQEDGFIVGAWVKGSDWSGDRTILGTDNFSQTIRVPVPSDFELQLHFNEGVNATFFEDSSPENHDGVCIEPACPTVVTDTVFSDDRSFYFDGYDDRVEIDNYIPLWGSFTIAAVVKRDANSYGANSIVGKGVSDQPGSLLQFGFRDGAFTCAFGGDDLVVPTSHTDTEWHRWDCTYDAGDKSRIIYRDGVEVARDTAADDFNDSGYNPLYIGWANSINNYFAGYIDEVEIYNRALAASEIEVLSGLSDGLETGFLNLGVRDGKPYFGFGDSTQLIGNTTLNPNQWYYLQWKYDYEDSISSGSGVGTQRIYINDTFDSSQSDAFAFQGAGAVMVGRSGGGNAFAGLIDELSISKNYIHMYAGEMEQVPALNLHLDESLGATTFSDDSHNVFSVSCNGSSCPNAGTKGQMRQALSFDGGDYVSLPTLEELQITREGDNPYFNSFTLTSWVNARDVNGSRPIFSAVDSSNQLLLGIQDGKAVFSTQEHGTMYGSATLSPNQWVHLAWSYESGRGRHTVFVNGIQDKQIEDAWIRDWANQPVMLGSAATDYFVGKLDEVALYNRELSDEEIKSIYESQIRWVDVSNDHAIVVDGEDPTVVLQAGDGYIQNTDIILTIKAADITSDIAAVEYNIDGAGWHPATQDRNAWVFRFNPDHNLGEGLHTIQVRATDMVGNQAESSGYVTIDDTPPAFILAVDTNIVQPAPHDEAATRWQLELSGTINDASSGAATLQVSIYDYAGQSVGASQFINIGNSSWEMDYPFNFAPNGAYQTQFVVTDNVGNSNRFTETIKVDGIAPAASIIAHTISGNIITSTNTVLTGTVSDIPYLPNSELMLHLEGSLLDQFYDSSAFKYDGACTPPACPTRQAGKYGQGLRFDGSDDSISISNGPVITFTQDPAITLAAWVKPNGGASPQSLFYAELGGDSALEIQLNGNDLNGTLTFSDTLHQVVTGTVTSGQWNHVALVYDGASVHTYVNGRQSAVWKKTDAADIFIGLDQLWLGSRAGTSAFYTGELDEIVLYNRSLSSDQIYELANPAISGVVALDVGFLHFGSDEQPVWYPAALAQPGKAISTWSIQIPEGIEGPQQIHLRPADAFNNSRVLPNVLSVDVDTQVPRIELRQTWIIGGLRYTTVVTDYNLTEENFNSPCGIGVITAQKTLTETWYTDLYGADAPSRLVQLTAECDLSAEPTLSEVGSYDALYPAKDVTVSGNYAYVVDDRALKIVNISDPTAPSLTGDYYTGNWAQGVAVAGNYAYVVNGSSLQVINVSDPANPSWVGEYYTLGEAKDVAVSGNYAYIAAHNKGLLVVDVSDPANPVLTGAHSLPGGYAYGVALSGIYAYVADGNEGLQVVDISDPANPSWTGKYEYMQGWVESVTIFENYAYTTASDEGLQIINISDPANPILIGTHNTPGITVDVAVAGDYAYVANIHSGLQVVDISDPTSPSLTDAYDTPGEATGVAIAGAYAYVADGYSGLRIVDTSTSSGTQATACDAFGRCDTAVPSVKLAVQPRQVVAEPAISTWIDAPRLLLDTTPLTMTGFVQGQQASLKEVVVTVDSQSIYSQTWNSGSVTETVIEAPWTPSGEGSRVVTLSATDWFTGTGLYTATIILDTLPPTVTLDKNIWNTQDYNRLSQIILSGGVQDANDIIRLDASAKSATMNEPITLLTEFEDAGWQAFLPADHLNGVTYTVVLTATDIAHRETVFSDIITVDTVHPPDLQDLTLGYQNVTSYTQVIPGDTIRDVLSPTLTLTWTVAADSDAVGYTVEWLNQISSTYQLLQTDVILSGGPFSSSFDAAELQKIYARLTTRDVYNNIITQTVGPIYMDYYLTPAYVDMGAGEASGQPYRTWLDESCNLLGADLRLDERANELAALDSPQNLYTSWDDAGLRLTWTGANWDIDGDLFIYLDSQDGGSDLTYNPYLIGETLNIINEHDVVMLPFEADYAVWIHDSDEAELLAWQGDNWTVINSTFQYVFDANQITPYTDLYIPFTSIGIAQPSGAPLSMLAFATEENGLHLWSALPARSNLNSELIGAVSMEDGQHFKLTQSYDWLALNDNVCPTVIQTDDTQLHVLNAGTSTTQGADVRASIQIDEPGIAYGIYQDNLYMLQDRQFGLAESPNPLAEMCARYPTMTGCAGEPQPSGTPIMYNILFDPQPFKDLDAVMSVRPGVLGMGDVITYNLTVRNRGTLTATGVQVRASGGQGPITLPEASWACGSLDIDVGDLAPGETRTITFNGRIDDEQFCFAWLEGWARMNVIVKDDHGTIDWINIEHRLDSRAPHYVEIESPQALIRLGENIIQGFVADETSVPTITLQVVTDATSTFICEDETPDDGAWSCPVNVTGAVEGDSVQLRVRATDEWGHQTDWFTDNLLVVDSTPPTVTLSLATETALSDQRMGGNETRLQGELNDNYLLDSVEVCEGAICEQAELLQNSPLGQGSFTYDDEPDAPLGLIGFDTDCVQGTPITRLFTVTEEFIVDDVNFGLTLEHNRRNDTNISLHSPAGTAVPLGIGPFGAGQDNIDVLFDDLSPLPVDADPFRHDVSTPYYENKFAPYRGNLDVFHGESAQGVWQLSICDYEVNNGSERDNGYGVYHRSRLVLIPKTEVVTDTAATWAYNMVLPADIDGGPTRTLHIYGLDNAGNRSEPMILTFDIDTAAPVITDVLETYQEVWHRGSPFEISGRVLDSSPIHTLQVQLMDPAGNISADNIHLVGDTWVYTDTALFAQLGDYLIWIEAQDDAGNSSNLGPLPLRVIAPERYDSYLPLIFKDGSAIR